MENVSIIGIDLAKRSFQLHGAASDGSVAFRKKLSRPQLLAFLADIPDCIVAMEACATSHYWGPPSPVIMTSPLGQSAHKLMAGPANCT